MGKHLDALKDGIDGRVFSIKAMPDGTFRIREECDGYFAMYFTADELRELAQEIIEVAGGLAMCREDGA